MAKLDARLEELAQMEDQTAYRNHRKAMFKDIKDLFEIKDAHFFSADTFDMLNAQRREIATTQQYEYKLYSIDYDNDGNPIATPDNVKGWCYIGELPPKNTDLSDVYGCGTDPIQGLLEKSNRDSKNSKFGFCVGNRMTNTIVAFFEINEQNPDINFDRITMLQQLYGKAKNLIERNMGGTILQLYKSSGMYNKDWLMTEPTWCSPKQNMTNYLSINSNDKTKPKMLTHLELWIIENIKNIKSTRIIDALIKLGTGLNSDLGDAIMLYVEMDREYTQILNKVGATTVVENKGRIGIKIINGITTRVYLKN
jgi:hypothetical protein